MKKTRRLIGGSEVEELSKPHRWGFESKCPAKYLHIDCETGDVWVAGYTERKLPRGFRLSKWQYPSEALVKSALIALRRYVRISNEEKKELSKMVKSSKRKSKR